MYIWTLPMYTAFPGGWVVSGLGRIYFFPQGRSAWYFATNLATNRDTLRAFLLPLHVGFGRRLLQQPLDLNGEWPLLCTTRRFCIHRDPYDCPSFLLLTPLYYYMFFILYIAAPSLPVPHDAPSPTVPRGLYSQSVSNNIHTAE